MTRKLGKLTKYILVILLMTIIYMFTGCSLENKQSIQVNTIPIVKFTDEKIDVSNNIIIQKSVSQRTNDITVFIVEYWYKTTKESEIYHYGYIIKYDNEEIYIIKEGKYVTNTIFLDEQ